MYEWLGSEISRFFNWIETLQPRTAAVLGAIATAVIGVLWQYALLPLLQWLRKVIGAKLYPLISGAILLDRYWALPKYLDAIGRRVSHLSNPWLDESQKLIEIFVPVSATTGVDQNERMELSKLFLRHRKFVLIGDPGSGKTTGLKSIAIGCLAGKLVGSRRELLVPIFISLRQLSQSRKNVDDFVVAEFEALNFPHARRLLQRLENNGQLVFLLDGLDEVDESDRSSVLSQIAALLDRQDREHPSRVIVTSRPVGYDEQLRGNVEATVRMADFNLMEIRKFVSNWDFRPPKSRDRLLAAISDRRPIFEICKNPLMLTIVTSLYRDYDYTLPDSREEFYRVCVDALLRRWDESRNLEQRNKIQATYKVAFLEEFAFAAIEQSALDFQEVKLLSSIEGFLHRRHYKHIDSQRFLTELLRSGLLARFPTGEIVFAHKTLAESLAAAHLRSKPGPLMALWSKKPDAWLEVCSLFVSNPKAAENDIDQLLDAATQAKNWNHLLVLAGEAHFCPEKHRSLIVDTLTKNPDLWQTLDPRSVVALAGLGEGTPELLTAMIRSPMSETRTRAIRALGSLTEEWAVELLGDLLVSGVDSATTGTALASMGNDGLSVIAAIIAGHRSDEAVIVSCLRVMEQIGTLQALEAAIPLLWESNSSVNQASAATSSKLLHDPVIRAAFESATEERFPQEWSSETATTAEWAVPWIPTTGNLRVKAIYARIIDLLSSWLTESSGIDNDTVRRTAPVLFIPAAILAGRPWAERQLHAVNDEREISGRIKGESRDQGIITLAKTVVNEPLSANRRLWARSAKPSRADIALTEATAVIFLLALILLSVLPLFYAPLSGAVSWRWLLTIGGMFLTAAAVGGAQKEWDLFWAILFMMPLGAALLTADFIRNSRRILLSSNIRENSILILGGTWPLFGSAYLIWVLGGYWWLCLLPHLAAGLWFDVEEVRWVFVRRRNPMTELLNALENTR